MLKLLKHSSNPYRATGLDGGSAAASRPARQPALPQFLVSAAISLAVLAVAFSLDGPVARLVTLGPSPLLGDFAFWASKAGEGWVIAAAGAVVSCFLFFRRHFAASRLVILVAVTGLLTGGAATVIRSLLGRTRPSSHELQGFYGIWHDSHWILGQYEFGAFPSGHTATVVGLAAAAWFIDRRIGLLAACYAIMVGWSRIALGCHHFSDTVAAGILGIYGAHLVLTRLGPTIDSVGQHMQNAWLTRKRSLGSAAKEGKA